MTTNNASDDTLIRDSQLSGFGAFKERLGSCCCRLLKKGHTYDLSSVSKETEEVPDKPAHVNQAFQREKQARKEKLDKIARTLPNNAPLSNASTTAKRPLTTVTQATPRSAVGAAQTRPALNPSSATRPGIATTITRQPAPPKKDPNETSTGRSPLRLDSYHAASCRLDESSEEEESSSDDDQSSDSDRPPAKKPAAKRR